MRSRPLIVAICAVALAALLVPAISTAAKKGKKDPTVTVMTRNLYLGSSLGAALDATSIEDAVEGAGSILEDVEATKFPERAVLLAKEIKKSKADLIGLQEVALWRTQQVSDYTTTPAEDVLYDWLDILMDELKDQGAKYKVAVVQDEFDAELPADVDSNNATGEGPLAFAGADIDGRLTMRDAILVRKGSKVDVSKPDMGQFVTRYEPLIGGAVTLPVDRGWVSVEAKVKGNKKRKGASFKFVNAHLEAFGDRAIKTAQGRELFENGGPLNTKKQLIFLGDINSGGDKDNVGTPGGSGIPEDQGPYNALVGDFGIFNVGARQTCCYPSEFASDIGSYRFDHTVDHVMVKPKIKQLDAYVTGDDPTVTTPSGLVASDHGGLVSKLKLSK